MFQVFVDGLCTPLGFDLTDGPAESVSLSLCDCIPFAIGPYIVELRTTTETPLSVHDTDILGKLIDRPVQWPHPHLLGVDSARLHAILQPHEAETIPEVEISETLVGSVVITAYNGRAYRIRGLKQPAPEECEKLEGFYRERHNIQVTIDKPLLWAWDGLPVRALELGDGHPTLRDGWFRHELKPAPSAVPTSSRSKKKSPILLLPQLCTAFGASDVLDALRFLPSVQDHVWWYSRVGHLSPYITVPRPTLPCWHDGGRHLYTGTERAYFLLLSALTWPGEYRGAQLELLEWFGDTVIDVLASVEAHERRLPMVDAEALRGGLVSNAHLALLGPILPNIPNAILGKPFRVKNADHKALADIVEAVVGALTLAYDVACAKKFLEALHWYNDPPCQPRTATLPSTSALVGKAVVRFLASYVCMTTSAIDVGDFHVRRQLAVDNANWEQVADAWWSGASVEELVESTGMLLQVSTRNSASSEDDK